MEISAEDVTADPANAAEEERTADSLACRLSGQGGAESRTQPASYQSSGFGVGLITAFYPNLLNLAPAIPENSRGWTHKTSPPVLTHQTIIISTQEGTVGLAVTQIPDG